MPAFSFKGSGAHRDLHSSPTRRSSDLPASKKSLPPPSSGWLLSSEPTACSRKRRSEEHTSELQSRLHPVCPLFLLKDPAPTEISTLPLHDALPIYRHRKRACRRPAAAGYSPANPPHAQGRGDRKSTRLNSSHGYIPYARFFF